ncbi:hypothetical protein RHMOL_Rhmol07G0178800 [Rhododendron molle]|uniref:Uncharacterized protein n=1 Tax=Rhododendron molle TaxID=49168 RepID=A0ACC0N312_RHOML|nr:hypothetical protein RHMOL_Rhmol07G0178800 [Rhododendron molle]
MLSKLQSLVLWNISMIILILIGDSDSHALNASMFSKRGREMLHHLKSPYNMDGTQSMDVHSHFAMESSESSVKNSSHDELRSVGVVFSLVVERAEERVKDNGSGFHDFHSLPHFSKSGMDYFVAYKPTSNHTRAHEGQQSTVGCVTKGPGYASDNTKPGDMSSNNQTQDNPHWSVRDNMKGSISRKPLNRKKCVIMGRDFLLIINRNLQPSLETAEPFQFFRRASVSIVEVRARFKLF